MTLSFYRDAYSPENHDKRCRVRIPWLWHSKKGNMVVDGAYIASEPVSKIERKILGKIKTTSGLLLPHFHAMMRVAVFGHSNPTLDVSLLHAESLKRATRRPEMIYRDIRGYDRIGAIDSMDESLECYRPPASWYYPLYLSWFLNGSMVLLETYENPDGGVPEAKKLFEQTMFTVQSATGFLPLVVEIPPLTPEMLYCNRHLIDSPDCLGTIGNRTNASGE